MFRKQFIAAKDYDLEASSLTIIKQQQGENLKKFIQRMMDVAAKTKVTNYMKMVALTSRLTTRSLLGRDLQHKRADTLSEFLIRSQGFINLEDAYAQAYRAVAHGQLFVPRQQGAINPPQGLGHPQVPRIQALKAQALQGAQNTLTAAVVVAPNPRNFYPLGVVLPALDGHVAFILGGPHIARSTQNSQKQYLNELNQGKSCHLVKSPS
uniref:Retrotransposon gag domain-containing protein n=1 Tax=Cannabis sativa TaxID=3483 RepID=A0A803QHM7_CANSA